jgi:hypothetical protein
MDKEFKVCKIKDLEVIDVRRNAPGGVRRTSRAEAEPDWNFFYLDIDSKVVYMQ